MYLLKIGRQASLVELEVALPLDELKFLILDLCACVTGFDIGFVLPMCFSLLLYAFLTKKDPAVNENTLLNKS